MAPRPPPGRAGRVWLAARIDVARRASQLLDQKQQLLRREQRRLAELAGHTRRDWDVAAAAADLWNARVLVAGGSDDVRRAAAGAAPAHARIGWATQAGVRYPATAAAELAPVPAMAGSASLAEAAVACGAALDAAVRHAAATTAVARIDAELALTARRLRAIHDRWLPALEAQLDEIELRLDDTEREEITRLRWADRCATTLAGTSP